jgi:hypothetical protein
MKHIASAVLAAMFLSPAVHAAAPDSNGNGMSDAWERRFNGYELFPASILPGDDADGDGVSNLDECNAGTDPFDGKPPLGFLQAKVRHVSAVYTTPEGGGDPVLVSPEAFVISWPSQYGKHYTLNVSPDLSPGSWLAVGEPEYGYGEEIEIATLPTYQDGTVADKFFWRIAVTDIDSDGDGFSDHDEWLKGTDIWVADRDDDGLPDDWENLHGLDPDDDGTTDPDQGPYGDIDSDELWNIQEYWYGTNPNDADTDDDDLSDGEEVYSTYTDPTKPDTNGNGIPDRLEDPDRDGLTNLAELRIHHTYPRNPDTDGDKLRDGWEVANGLDPLVYNDITDPDSDGLTNVQEQRLGLNPLDSDTDDDGTPDGQEDPDGDGLTNLAELNTHHTDPLKADSDNDGLSDPAEINTHLTNPTKHDTDSDGMPDGWEVQHSLNPKNATGSNGATGDPDNDGLDNFHEWLNGSDPHNADTDGDGANDLTEVTQGSDPNDPTDGGNPPEDEIQEVDFKAFGDYASWRMEIRGEGPRDHRTQLVVTPAVGVPETGTIKLRRNNKYKVTLHHTGSIEGTEVKWYCWEALVEDKPGQATFQSYEPDRIPGAAMFFTIGDGHWLVDNRDGLFSAHNHRTEEEGGNAAAGLEATLLPMETVVGDAQNIEEAPEGFVAAEAVPTPSVDMSVTSSTLQGGSLEVRLQGTVKDSVSRFAQSAAERPQSLKFYHQDELLHSIPLDDTVGDGFVFDETVEIPNAQPQTYVIRAETTANIAGNKGYDESSVSLTWEEDASAFPTLSAPLSFAFAAAPGNNVVDQATLFVGNGSPQAGDTASVETAVDSLTFAGNLLIPAQPANLTAPCQLRLQYLPAFSTTEADSLVVRLEFTAPGFPKNHFYGRWVETGANTLIFRPGTWTFGNQLLKTSQTAHHDLRGTPPSDIEAGTIRFPSLPADLAADGLQVVSGGIAYDLINKGGNWYPEDPDEPGEIKRFMPSARPVPALLQAPGYDPQDGVLKFQLRFPGTSDLDAADILIVPGEEIEDTSPPPAVAARIYSLENASTETPPPWQSGNPVIPEHVIWAYRFLNANDTFAIELLDGYLRGGHKIETGDVSGDTIDDLDLDVTLNDLNTDADNIWTIQIEEDINPIHAARLLFEGLKQASPYKEVFDNYAFEDPMDEILAFKAAMDAAVQKTQETAVAATEMYLSGLGIVNEGLDWIIVVNDVSEGHWESLAAALPFIPAGLVKTGGHMIIRKGATEVLDTLDTAGVATLKEVAATRKLATIGTVFDDEGYSMFLRKVVTSESGPITPPTRRATLKDRMAAISPRPGGLLGWMKYEAHHDLPWEMKEWFARHGIDVNDAAYGRWANKADHKAWHQGDGRGGAFNAWWRKVEDDERLDMLNGNSPLTKLQIIEKLEECRSIFTQEAIP